MSAGCSISVRSRGPEREGSSADTLAHTMAPDCRLQSAFEKKLKGFCCEVQERGHNLERGAQEESGRAGVAAFCYLAHVGSLCNQQHLPLPPSGRARFIFSHGPNRPARRYYYYFPGVFVAGGDFPSHADHLCNPHRFVRCQRMVVMIWVVLTI